jgi:RHS repeat-associated protein
VIDASTSLRVQAAAVQATQDTAKPKAKTPPVVKRYVWGVYVDELMTYTLQKPRHAPVRYYTHSNHLYSVSATTNVASAVVERYSYNAYGVRTVKNPAGATLAKSAVNQYRGFTGYIVDSETGLLHARARQYSPTLGRFVERDPWRARPKRPTAMDGYADGYGLYMAYSVPYRLDPYGMLTWDDFKEVDVLPPNNGGEDAFVAMTWQDASDGEANPADCTKVKDDSCKPGCCRWTCTAKTKKAEIQDSYQGTVKKGAKGNAALLQHETGHVAISRANARAGENEIKGITGSGSDCEKGKALDASMSDWTDKEGKAFEKWKAKDDGEQGAYETVTDHGKNAAEQGKYNKRLGL